MVTVKRIVPDLSYRNPAEMQAFYRDVLSLELVMDLGWVATLTSASETQPQVTLAKNTGDVAPVMSVEVDDVDAAYRAAVNFGAPIVRALQDEPWGVRRFFTSDPDGNILNILAHL